VLLALFLLMPSSRRLTHQRLVRAAIQLFTAQGITETTTRQIAELAEVNEVTLFRQFGSKYGLLLAVMEESSIFTWLGEVLSQQAGQQTDLATALRSYADIGLQGLEQIPELVRSLIGEAGHYPAEHRHALGRGITQANHYTAQYIATILHRQSLQICIPPDRLAALLNSLMLGYLVLKLTSEADELWQDRTEFLSDLVDLMVSRAVAPATAKDFSPPEVTSFIVSLEVADLPATLVHTILKRAQKNGLQDYAIAYVLFAAGLTVSELVRLERSHSFCDTHQHLLQIPQGRIRQVLLNQWILGKRYGSHPNNPLTRWLRGRKDSQPALFLNEAGTPLSEVEIRLRWQVWIEELLTPQGQPPTMIQTYDTWCVEMVMKGVNVEDLSILTGRSANELQPYMRRAREKLALEQAIRLDQKLGNSVAIANSPESQPLG